jgi:hypothetical protein
MRQSSWGAATVAALAIACGWHLGCGGSTPTAPSPETAAAKGLTGSSAGVSASAKIAIPPQYEPRFRQLPLRIQTKFLQLPAATQARILSLPDEVLNGVLNRVLKRSRRRGDVGSTTLPNAVIRTRPAAVDGVISGKGPLLVIFNTCRSSDVDEGDQLKTTVDFDNDGQVDYAGAFCRPDHTYEDDSKATVCVTDRNRDSKICKTFKIDVFLGGGGGCRTVFSHSASSDGSPQFFTSNFFDVATGVGMFGSVTTTALYAYTYAGCPGGFYVYASVYGPGSASDSGVAPAAATGCQAYSSAYNLYVPESSSHSVQVCDPGAF